MNEVAAPRNPSQMRLSVDDLPMFFDDEHQQLAKRLRAVATELASVEVGDEGLRDAAAAHALAEHGLFAWVSPRPRADGETRINTRAVCLVREMLGYVSARADSIFAVQGLGTYALAMAGNDAQRATAAAFSRPTTSSTPSIAAFALTEPEAGSDVASLTTRASKVDGGWRLNGEKIFISNLGIASHATVFARAEGSLEGHRAITAFWLPLDLVGVTVTPQSATAPHPIGALALRDVFVNDDAVIGVAQGGGGFGLAMQTLDAFRVTVGAAAVGMARRALDEAIAHVCARQQFGKPLAEQQLVQAHLADMAVDLDAARLLVLRAAWARDTQTGRSSTEVSIAKLGATEAASRVIDRAVQLLGGRGVMAGAVVEQLYRAIRPLRIYEGTSEIQRSLIGRALTSGGRA